jgi:sugar phosphate permease
MRLSRAQKQTLFVVWVSYAAFYLCRVAIGPARESIQKSLGIDALAMGFVLGSLKIGYAGGQVFTGQLTERFGARRVLLVGMLGSAAVCLLFASAPELAAALGPALPPFAGGVERAVRVVAPAAKLAPIAALLLALWFANGFFQAGGWPPTVKIISVWFTPTERGRIMGVIGTSYQVGSAVTILGAGALLSYFHDDWRAAFVFPTILFLFAAIHATLRVREHPREGEAPSVDALALPASIVHERLPMLESLRLTLGNGRVWILALGLFGVDIVRYGFLDWAPGHLKHAQGTTTLVAALKVAVFPLAGALGALFSGWATDRWFQSRRAPMIAVCLGMAGVLTIAYGEVVHLGAMVTVACLAGVGFFLYAAHILLVGTAAQDFAKGRASAAAAGFIDFMGHFGAFGGDVVTGGILRRGTFHTAIHFWAGSAIVAALLCATLWRAQARDAGAPSP